jgi:hypothetical protein
VRYLRPSACARGAKLPAADQVVARVYDHVELPPNKPVTTPINLHRADCKIYADLCSIVATGRLNGRSSRAAIRAALTIRSEHATA